MRNCVSVLLPVPHNGVNLHPIDLRKVSKAEENILLAAVATYASVILIERSSHFEQSSPAMTKIMEGYFGSIAGYSNCGTVHDYCRVGLPPYRTTSACFGGHCRTSSYGNGHAYCRKRFPATSGTFCADVSCSVCANARIYSGSNSVTCSDFGCTSRCASTYYNTQTSSVFENHSRCSCLSCLMERRTTSYCHPPVFHGARKLPFYAGPIDGNYRCAICVQGKENCCFGRTPYCCCYFRERAWYCKGSAVLYP